MIEGFDKEIDLLLRQTAQGEIVSDLANPKSEVRNPKSAHLDADELSAFAENALPEKTRLNYIVHLADCDRCRKILSNLIELNSETQSEIIHAEEPAVSPIAAAIPWYRKLFAVPTLAYAMGGLILLFAGFGVFTILQNNSRNAEVSQTYEKQIGGKGMASDGDALTQEMPGNRASTNSSMNSAAASNSMANASNSAVAPSAMANSNAATKPREVEPNLAEGQKDDKTLLSRSQPQKTESSGIPAAPAPAPPPPPPAKQSDDFTTGEQKETQPPSDSGQNQTQSKPPMTARAPLPVAGVQKDEENQDVAKLSLKRKAADTIVVSGKTFNRANNAWVDAAYRGQATTNVSRGTNEYKKLDSGLRGIVENLGGTVVIVWKEKAYRIQ